MRHSFVHVVLGDHTRLADAELHDDELGITATAVLRRAVAWFADRGMTARRMISGIGGHPPISRSTNPPGPYTWPALRRTRGRLSGDRVDPQARSRAELPAAGAVHRGAVGP
jgi:hypothetical protein